MPAPAPATIDADGGYDLAPRHIGCIARATRVTSQSDIRDDPQLRLTAWVAMQGGMRFYPPTTTFAHTAPTGRQRRLRLYIVDGEAVVGCAAENGVYSFQGGRQAFAEARVVSDVLIVERACWRYARAFQKVLDEESNRDR